MAASDEEQLELFRVYAVGTRKPLLMGCDREMVLFAGLLCATLAYAGMSLDYTLLAIVTFFISLSLLRRMAKADPLMRQKAVRHMHICKQAVYRARSTPFAGSHVYHIK